MVLIVVLICIYLMVTNDEHTVIYLWGLCMSSLEKCLFRSFARFLIGFFVFLEWSFVSLYIFWRSNPCLMYHMQYIFPYSWFTFHFANVFFSHAEAYYFYEVPFLYSFLYVTCSRGHLSENIAIWNI